MGRQNLSLLQTKGKEMTVAYRTAIALFVLISAFYIGIQIGKMERVYVYRVWVASPKIRLKDGTMKAFDHEVVLDSLTNIMQDSTEIWNSRMIVNRSKE